MGISSPAKLSPADALSSSTQQRVLGLLFGAPEQSFFVTEIIQHLGAGSGAVQRELKKLTDSGLLTNFVVGNQKHYQANVHSPIFAELRSILRKTVGLAEPLQQALDPLSSEIELALVYSSTAKGNATAASDIDLLVVSDSLTLEDLYRHLAGAESYLARPINPTLYTAEEFLKRLREGNVFLKRLLDDETLLLKGSLPDGE